MGIELERVTRGGYSEIHNGDGRAKQRRRAEDGRGLAVRRLCTEGKPRE